MSYWHYVNVYKVCPHTHEKFCEVHEIYLDDEDKIEAITENPVNLIADNPDDLTEMLKMIQEDIANHPAIDYNMLRKYFKERNIR